jgi:predicted RNA-binding protein associated with RNAse of E/G family
MSLHPPKRISSTKGLGLNTTKKLDWVSDTLAYGTEVWGELEKPWQQDETIIALPGYVWRTRWEVGKPYIVNKYLNDKGELVGVYCDICRPVEKTGNGLEFDDLYLDVWQIPGQAPVILDEDELEEAISAGYLSSEEADKVRLHAEEVKQLLLTQPDLLDF